MNTTTIETPHLSLEIDWEWEWQPIPHTDKAAKIPEVVGVTVILDDLRSDATFDFGASNIVQDAVARDARWGGDVLTPEGAPT